MRCKFGGKKIVFKSYFTYQVFDLTFEHGFQYLLVGWNTSQWVSFLRHCDHTSPSYTSIQVHWVSARRYQHGIPQYRYNTVQYRYNTVQYRYNTGTIQYNTGTIQVQYRYNTGTIQVQYRYNTVQYRYNTVQYRYTGFLQNDTSMELKWE